MWSNCIGFWRWDHHRVRQLFTRELQADSRPSPLPTPPGPFPADGCTSLGSGDLSVANGGLGCVTLRSCPARAHAMSVGRVRSSLYVGRAALSWSRAAATAAHPGIHHRQTDNLTGFPLASARLLSNALIAHFMGRAPTINL
ncbi:unnamed protein product [Lota lota]